MLKIKNFQLDAWKRFFSKEIDEFLAGFNFTTKAGLRVSFSASNANAFMHIKHPRGLQDAVETLKVCVTLSSESPSSITSSTNYPNVPLAVLPLMTNDGIVIGGTKYGATSNMIPAGGWYISMSKDSSNPYPLLQLRKSTVNKWTFAYRDGRLVYVGQSGKTVPVINFIRAYSPSNSNSEVRNLFEYNPIIESEFLFAESERVPIETCVQQVLEADDKKKEVINWADITELKDSIYKNDVLRIGPERVPRFENFVSFQKALGLKLAEDVDVNGTVVPAGTVLSYGILKHIDNSDVANIYVMKDDAVYHLYKVPVKEQITFEEIVCAIHHFCNFCNGLGVIDKQDNYCNKVLEPIGADIEKFLGVAMKKLTREISKSVGMVEITMPSLPNSIIQRQVTVDDFRKHLLSSRAYKLLDQVNSMATFEQEFRVNGSTTQNIPISARDVQKSQYGCVCPYTTSESNRVGLNLSLSTLSQVDQYGFLTTPVIMFKNGKCDEEMTYLSTIGIRGKIVAPFDANLEEAYAKDRNTQIQGCRFNGQTVDVSVSEVDCKEVSPLQVFGPLVANVPSAERDAGKRLLMAGSAQKQAIPTWGRERPYVSTAIEALADIGVVRARDVLESGLFDRDIETEIPEGTKLYLVDIQNDGATNVLRFRSNHPELKDDFTYVIHNMSATIKGSPRHTRVNIKKNASGDVVYELDDIVLYNNDIELKDRKTSTDTISFGNIKADASSISDHGLALGNNVLVMFKSYDGWGYEDSIVVRKGFVNQYGLAILTTYAVTEELEEGEKFGYNTNNLNSVSYMYPNGLPKVGTFLKSGQDVIGKMVVEQMDPILGLGVNTKWTTKKMDIKVQGYVLSATITGKTATVVVGDISILDVGDKLAGVHGNKGVVGHIVPDNEMPFTEDGEIPDIILNPLGVISRNNLGQMVEHTEGAIGYAKDEIQVLPPFSGKKIGEILGDAECSGVVEKTVYDGRTGVKFPKKAMLGVMHFLRLEHTSVSKYKACSTGASAINPRTLQINGKQGGAQKISEMGSWCLNSYGADALIDTLFTIQSDDIMNKEAMTEGIKNSFDMKLDYKSSNLDFLNAYFRLLGANLEWHEDGFQIRNLTSKDIKELSNGDCDLSFGDADSTQRAYQMIRDPKIFGKWEDNEKGKVDSRKLYGRLPLLCEVVMPMFLRYESVSKLMWYYRKDGFKDNLQSKSNLKVMSERTLDDLLSGKLYIYDWVEPTVNDTVSEFVRQFTEDPNFIPLVPVLANSEEVEGAERTSPEFLRRTNISGVVEIFNAYDLETSLLLYDDCLFDDYGMDLLKYLYLGEDGIESCKLGTVQEMLDGSNNLKGHNLVRQFMKDKKLSDFVVDGLAVPPIGYRPEFGDKPATAMDQQIHAVIVAVKQLRSAGKGTSVWYSQVQKVWESLLEMITDKNQKSNNKNVRQELTDHSSHASVMRDTLLAKRVSYSGRSVISINPKLKIGQCGVPFSIAAKIFEDHIIAKIQEDTTSTKYPNINDLNLSSMRGSSRKSTRLKKVIVFLANNNINGFADFVRFGISVHQAFYACKAELRSILEDLLKVYPVILDRDPTLHKFSYAGFWGVLTDGYSLQLHPLSCHGFNADFDGDQMAIFIPQHPDAVKDVLTKMMHVDNIINPKDCEPIVAINQDIILGLYYCSMYKDNALIADMSDVKAMYCMSDELGYDRYVPLGLQSMVDDLNLGRIQYSDIVAVRVDGKTYINSAGRILINALIPNRLGFTGFHKFKSSTDKNLAEEIKAQKRQRLFSKTDDASDDDLIKNPRYSEFYKQNTMMWNGAPVYELAFDFLVKKGTVKEIISFVTRYYEEFAFGKNDLGDSYAEFFDRLMTLGFRGADISGVTLSLYDFDRLPVGATVKSAMSDITSVTNDITEMYNLGMLTEAEKTKLTTDSWSKFRQDITKDLDSCFKGGKANKYNFDFDRTSNIFMIVDSGSRGDTYQLVEIAGLIGNVTNAQGQTLETPIRSNYIEGMSVGESFNNSYASRRDVMAAQLSTKDAGTLTRELIYSVEHLHTRPDDDFCGAHSSQIDLEYDVVLNVAAGTRIFLDEMTPEVEKLWSSEDIKVMHKANHGTIIDPAAEAKRYSEFCRDLKQLYPYDYVSQELSHFLALRKLPYIVIDSGSGYTLVPVKYKLKSYSRQMLHYRCIDLDVFDDDEDLRNTLYSLREKVVPSTETVNGEIRRYNLEPEEEYVVVGEDMIDEIERRLLDSVFIWTITGCQSTEGICKKCYGIKYDTKQFPGHMEYIGYQGIQSIGEPLAQIVLDAHKRADGGQDGGSKAKLHQLIRKPHDASGVKAVYARKSGRVRIDKLTNAVKVFVNDELMGSALNTKDIRVMPGDSVELGQILINGQSDYDVIQDLAGAQDSRIALWKDFLKIFDNQKIMARNFELLARSQSEFGIALAQSDDVLIGEVYPQNQLIKEGIPYKPIILDSANAMNVSGKIMAGIAHSFMIQRSTYHVVRGTKGSRDSNIGRTLIGDLKTNEFHTPQGIIAKAKENAPETTVNIAVDKDISTGVFDLFSGEFLDVFEPAQEPTPVVVEEDDGYQDSSTPQDIPEIEETIEETEEILEIPEVTQATRTDRFGV